VGTDSTSGIVISGVSAGAVGSAGAAGSAGFSSWIGVSSAWQAGHKVDVLPSSSAAPHLTQFIDFSLNIIKFY
jgi:hypothetical protein